MRVPWAWRLPLIAGLTWGSVLLALTHTRAPYALLLVSAIVGLFISRTRLPSKVIVVAAFAIIASAATSVAAHQAIRFPAALTEKDSSAVSVDVVTSVTLTPSRNVVRATIRAVDGGALAGVPTMVFLDLPSDRLPPGTTIRVEGQLKQTNRFDSRAWIVFADEWSVVGQSPEWVASADRLREDFLARSTSIGGDGGALLPGLSLGDTEAVTDSLTAAMRVSSLSHLVAVSGANCALVVGIAVLLTSLLGGGVWWRVGIGLITLAGFVIVVTPEPSVIRASVMASITLIAIATGRPHGGVNALSLTVWLLLLFDPWRAVDLAFALSVAATGGIVLGLVPVSKTLERWMPRWLALPIALPLVAQLAVLPFLVLLRPAIPTYGVVANLLAAPFVPLVTVCGLLGALAGPVWPWLADVCATFGWYPATAIASIARAVSALPAREVEWLAGPGGFALATLLSAGVWWLLLGASAPIGMGLVLLCASIVAIQLHVSRLVASLHKPSDWQVAQCDVGQGDAVVINTSHGYVLIDTGDDERKLRECLAILGVHRVAVLVLTHFDIDHMGQAHLLAGRVDLVLSGPPDNSADRYLLAQLFEQGAIVTEVAEGDQFDLGDYHLEVLWPLSPPISEPGNDSSVVTRFVPQEPKGLSLLGLGDLGEQAQQMLLPRLGADEVDIVKVSHHGSSDQLSTLYRDVSASVGLIGVGADNSYGHPAPETLQLLRSAGTLPLRSDERGTLTLRCGEDGIETWSAGGG